VVQRVGRVIALLFHDRGTRRGWVVSSTPWPHFISGKDPVPILQEAGWTPGRAWAGVVSRPHRDSIPDLPARISLYTDWATRPTQIQGSYCNYWRSRINFYQTTFDIKYSRSSKETYLPLCMSWNNFGYCHLQSMQRHSRTHIMVLRDSSECDDVKYWVTASIINGFCIKKKNKCPTT